MNGRKILIFLLLAALSGLNACSFVAEFETIKEEVKTEKAAQLGLDRKTFTLSPGGQSMEGLKYAAYQDGIAIFEFNSGGGPYWIAIATKGKNPFRNPPMVTHNGESRQARWFYDWESICLFFGDRWYTATITDIKMDGGSADVQLDISCY